MELAAEAEVGGKAMLRTKAIATTGFMGEMVAMRCKMAVHACQVFISRV